MQRPARLPWASAASVKQPFGSLAGLSFADVARVAVTADEPAEVIEPLVTVVDGLG